jgi:ribosomal protein S18 acetylase RimI-like enzyme
MDFSLRPAGPEAAEFLYSLMAETMKEYVTAIWGWDEPFQRDRFSGSFDADRWQLVIIDGLAVGAVSVERSDNELYLRNIYILPAQQRRGIGTAILNQLIEEADRAAVPLTLYVMKSNPGARQLYQRLGLTIRDEIEGKYRMIRPTGEPAHRREAL